jgi:uncharacterized Zn ribbon protein
MPPCPYCESENVIRTDTFHLEYECLDCRHDWTDWVDQDEWFDEGDDTNDREERNEPAHV